MYFFTLPSAVSLIALAIGVAYGAPTGAVKAKRWDDLDSQVVLFTMTGTDGSTYMLQTYPIDGQSHNLGKQSTFYPRLTTILISP